MKQKCVSKSLAIQNLSTLLQLSMVNLKDFLKVNPLAPNQVLGVCGQAC